MLVWWRKEIKPLLLAFLLVLSLIPLAWSQTPAGNLSRSQLIGTTTENWSSLSLSDSQLLAEPPLFGEKDDFPQFTRELIQVKWRFGDPIDLYVIRPKGVAKPPVVLYLYGYPSETARFRDNDYCVRLTRGGVAAVGFVSALTGQRYSNRPMKEWFVSELQESLGSSVHDVQMILNYLGTRNDLDMTRIGMFGEGSGASIAILSAAADPRIKALDLIDPWGDWPEWMAKSTLIPENERPNYIKPEFLKKVAPLDPVEWLPKLTQSIRLQHVLDDTVTPRIAKERIEAAAPANLQLVKYDTTMHFLEAASGGRVFAWMKDRLQPPAPTPAQGRSEPETRAGGASHDN